MTRLSSPKSQSGSAPHGSSAGVGPGRDWLAFDRFDRWGLAAMLGLVVVGAVVFWVVDPIVGWMRGEPLTPGMSSAVTVPQLDATGVGYGSADYAVDLVDPSVGQRLLDLAPGLAVTVLVGIVSWCLVGLLRTVGAGDPFEPRNVTRLRAVAGVLMLGVPVVLVLQEAVRGLLLADLDLGGLDVSFFVTVPWLPLVSGLVVALLSEAFKAGSRLRDDVDGLV